VPVAKKIAEASRHSSWIRQMFEEGTRLAQVHGRDRVFDFSIGNPNLEPPGEFQRVIEELVRDPGPGLHGYMSNAGYPETRAAVARHLAGEQGVSLGPENIVMTCGAGGALNVIFKAILDPGDEVIVPLPYFMEYESYVDNHGGVLRPVPTLPDFDLDLERTEAAMSSKTRAILINSPNNPTGAIYTEANCRELGALLARHDRPERPIYILLDDPYRRIIYDVDTCPTPLRHYPRTILISSYSKDVSIAGERIGYIAVCPKFKGAAELVGGLTLTNRILGFVNAPAIAQKILQSCLDSEVDVDVYAKRRALMAKVLDDAGIAYTLPRGAFYFFPKSPTADERIFVDALLKERVLAVPGRGFGLPGYFRLAFCADAAVIRNSAASFKRAVESL